MRSKLERIAALAQEALAEYDRTGDCIHYEVIFISGIVPVDYPSNPTRIILGDLEEELETLPENKALKDALKRHQEELGSALMEMEEY